MYSNSKSKVYWQVLMAWLWDVHPNFQIAITNEANGYRLMFHIMKSPIFANIGYHALSKTTHILPLTTHRSHLNTPQCRTTNVEHYHSFEPFYILYALSWLL
jgi:hypothetical protein